MPAAQAGARAPKTIRRDIQGLRGLAVLVVVLYHVGIGPWTAGYLGVDIFFVISGYLITTLVASGIERGDFTLAGFYIRRARRLLPAAYVTIALTLAAAPWCVDQQGMRDLAAQAWGALTFTANIVLWQQSGYFEGAADLKPLLHVWSLSLEEQYYLVLPAAMLALVRRRQRWLPMVAVALVASLALCLVGAAFKPVATFYLLPTRAWELLVGSAGALWLRRRQAQGLAADTVAVRRLFVPSLLALLALPAYPIGGTHPGLAAVLVCGATLVVILRRHPLSERSPWVRGLAAVGDFSYSLYLVHWPCMALLRNAWGNPSAEIPLALRAAALAFSIVAGYALYRLVERPIHHARWGATPRLVGWTALATVVLAVATPLLLLAGGNGTDYAWLRRGNHGFSPSCDADSAYRPRPECSSGGSARAVVWGDSFAMHLVPGLGVGAPPPLGVVQATMNTCGPFVGIAPERAAGLQHKTIYDRPWAERCIAFNDSVLDFVRRNPQIELVVLSSLLTAYTEGGDWQTLVRDAGGTHEEPLRPEYALAALKHTVDELHAANKKVVLVAPPPIAGFDVGACLERRLSGRIALGAPEGCTIDAADYRKRRAAVLWLLDAAEQAGIAVIRFDPWLCDDKVCRTLLDDTMVYRDYGHFSHAGVRLIAERMHLDRLIQDRAH